MLALLAIAFGKDMATATVISLEPFLEPSLNKENEAALPPPPPSSQGTAQPATANAALGTGVGTVGDAEVGHAQAALKDAPPGADMAKNRTHGECVEHICLVRLCRSLQRKLQPRYASCPCF